MSTYYPEAEKCFVADTTEHQMTVLHDDGLYRHLRFKAPGAYWYWFDIVTWPGNLAINGDMGSYVFARIEDMFDFFASGVDINPQYWEEKLQANSGVKTYSVELFERLVNEHATGEAEDIESEVIRARFLAAVKDEIIDDWDTGHEDGAREALDSFRFRVSPASADEDAVDIQFVDTCEWDFREYTVQYLWCCFAIRWGIAQYNAARAVTA